VQQNVLANFKFP